MSFANKHSKGTNKFNANTEGYAYVKLVELELGKCYTVQALYINRQSLFGPNPVAAITDGVYVNLPSYMTEEALDIIADVEDVADINAGKVGFVVEEYEKNGKTLRGIKWVDVLVK